MNEVERSNDGVMEEVLKQIEELKEAFQEDNYTEMHCEFMLAEGKCAGKDCCACVLERAIEIIKEEMM